MLSNQKAIPLLCVVGSQSDNYQFQVSDAAVKMLSKRTSNKVAVVSIFGECGTGKSSLLNQLLKIPDAFEVSKPTALSRLIKSPNVAT